MAKVMRDLDAPAQPRLTIPLTSDSKDLLRNVPQTLEDIQNQWRTIEPPSLFLLAWDRSKYLNVYEEYVRPLSFNPTSVHDAYVFYTEFRDVYGIRHDWEFDRSVCVDYYPADHQVKWSRLMDVYKTTNCAERE